MLNRKSKTASVIVWLAIVLTFLLVSAVGLPTATTAYAARSKTAWVTVGEIYNDEGESFNSAQLKTLYGYLTGTQSFEAVKTAAGEKKTSNDFRSLNGGKNIQITFGGVKWDVVYLTTATTNGDVILDLWRSSDTLTDTDKAQFATWSNSPSSDPDVYPSSMYSTSMLRVKSLNAGGKYSTVGDTLSDLQSQDESNQYARFTMESVEGSLTKYIAKPSEVGYQAKEYSDNISRDNSNKANNGFYHPNSSYEYVKNKELPGTNPQWNGSNQNSDGFDFRMCFGSEAKDALREDGAKYGSWKDDYLWLPSAEETGRESQTKNEIVVRTGIGIWYTDESLRSSTTNAWTRSGRTNDASMAVSLNDTGAYDQNRKVTSKYYVRPALHLNLTEASKNVALDKGDWTGDTKTYDPNNMTWQLEGTDMVTIEPMTNKSGTTWWDDASKTITATQVDDYQIKVTPKGVKWSDGSEEGIIVTYKVIPAEIAVEWAEQDDYTYKGEAFELPTATATGKGDDGQFALDVKMTAPEAGEFKDVGTYTFTAEFKGGALHAENYTLTSATKEITVTKAQVEVKWEETTYSYTALELATPKATAEGKGSDGTLTLEVKLTDPEAGVFKNAGNYTFTASLKEANEKNYELSGDVTHQYNVAKAEIEVTWEDATYTYTGSTLTTPKATATGKEDDGEFTLEVKQTLPVEGEFRNAGNYTFTASLNETDGANYELSVDSSTHQYNVAKAEIEVTWEDATYTYTGSTLTAPKATATGKGDDGEFTLEVKLTTPETGEFKDAGEYTFTASFRTEETKQDNYTLTSDTKEITVAKAQVEVKWEEATYTYTGSTQTTPKATADKVGDEGTLELEVTIKEPAEGEFKNAGNYTFEAKLSETDQKNYELNSDGTTQQYTIAKAQVDVTWTAEDSYTYNGNEQVTPTATATGVGSDETLTLEVTMQTPSAGTFKDAGRYTFQAALSDEYSANYALRNDATKTVEIGTASIAVTWTNDGSYTYKGAAFELPAARATGVGSDGEFTLEVRITKSPENVGTFKNAGAYTFTAAFKTNENKQGNYTLTSATKDLTVAKASAALKWEETSYTYTGSTLTAPKATAEGKGSDGTLTLQVTLTAQGAGEFKNAGSYTFTASLNATDAKNYELSGNATRQYTVARAIAEAEWEDATYTYTGSTLTAPKATAEGKGGDGALTLQVTLTTPETGEFKNAGEYTFTASLSETDAINYELSGNATRQYTVTKAEIEAEWEDVTYTYTGSVLTAPKVTATGIGDDGVFTLTVLPDFTGDFENAGSYTFKAEFDPSDETTANYTLKSDTVSSTYNVAKQTVNAPEIASKVYNGTAQKADVAISTLYTVTENNGGTNVGDYDVKLTLTDSANYVWQGSENETISLTFSITKATYDMSRVIFEGATFKEDGTGKSIAVSGQLPEGVTVTYENNNQTKFGVYEVVAKFSGDYANYNAIPDMTATLTLLRAELSVEASDTPGTDDEQSGPVVSVESEEGLDPTVELVVERKDTPSEESSNVLETNDSLQPLERVGAVYEISLHSDGVEVQPNGEIKIKIRIPSDMVGEQFRLLHIHGDQAIEIEYQIEGDFVVFTTDSLSEFVFTYKVSLWWLWLLLAVVVVAAVVTTAVVVSKRKQKRTK